MIRGEFNESHLGKRQTFQQKKNYQGLKRCSLRKDEIIIWSRMMDNFQQHFHIHQ